MSLDLPRSDTEQHALQDAERGSDPFLVLRDDAGRQVIVRLDGDRPLTVGRREEADIAVPWDRQVSRLHAELRRLAGEWTINDDGLSQNGTYVNEVRLVGRRRLMDGDDVRVGRTRMVFRDPTAHPSNLTLLPGELNAATAFSEQQQAILTELCRPLALAEPDADGRIRPAPDRRIADVLALDPATVVSEMAALYEAFGVAELPEGTARREVAQLALAAGVVRFDD